MQDVEKRNVFSEKKEESVKKEGFPWELSLLVASLAVGVILVALKIIGVF